MSHAGASHKGATISGKRRALLLSALDLHLEQDTLSVVFKPYPGDEAFERLKGSTDVFAYRQASSSPGEQLALVALSPGALDAFGKPVEVPTYEHLHLVAALLQHRVPKLLAQLALSRRKIGALRRVNRDDDLVKKTFAALGHRVPAPLEAFHKFARTDFYVRVVELGRRDPSLALAIELGRKFQITATAHELHKQGIRLQNLWAYDPTAARNSEALGLIVGWDRTELVMECSDGTKRIAAEECRVEPSIATFDAAFGQVLSVAQQTAYEQAEWTLQAQTSAGQGYVDQLEKIAKWFRGRPSTEVAYGLTCRFGELLAASLEPQDAEVQSLPEVRYCFAPDRSALHPYPAQGLERFGPFDQRTFDTTAPRLLVVTPSEHQGEVEMFVRRLLDGTGSEGGKRFVNGFRGIYRVPKVPVQQIPVSLPREGSPDVGERYVAALRESLDLSRPPNIALIVVRDGDAFTEEGNAYLAVKAFLLSQGIPTQKVRLATIRQRVGALAYTLENIAVAIYAKLGGSPWTVIPTMPLAEEIVIGIGVAETGGRFESRQRFAGITTVFRSDGTYVLAAASSRCLFEKFPTALGDLVCDTLRRLAVERGWQEGDAVRLIFHARQPLKKADLGTIVSRAVSQVGAGVRFETAFVTVRKDHPFKAIDPRQEGLERHVELANGGAGRRLVGVRVPSRGTVIDLGDTKRLLCVSGALLAKREGEPVPKPLLLELHPSSTYRDLGSLTRQVYHFTGLSWRSMLPVGEPVTIYYSRLVADLLIRLETVRGWSDALIDTKLRRSRWFL